jgi:hypothetical protein
VSCLLATWGLVWPALVVGLFVGLGVGFVIEGYLQEKEEEVLKGGFQEEWDTKEAACLEDPSCDLRKHDRLRENAQEALPPANGSLAMMAGGLVVVVALLGGLMPDWPERFSRANTAWRSA